MPAPLVLENLESFYVGGEEREVSGVFGPETQVVGAMYVQHLAPPAPKGLPVVFVHGGFHTGMTWETTPDGREGWQTLFLRGGFDTYVVDQAWRGRSAPDLNGLNPMVQDYGISPAVITVGSIVARMFERGGGRFAFAHLRAYLSQLWPDFGMPQALAAGESGRSDPRALEPLTALIDRIGPCVLVTHSQSGHLGWQAALARPDAVAAIYAVEPATLTGLIDAAFPAIPVCIVWGDGLKDDAINLSTRDLTAAIALAAERSTVTVDHLPAAGITGNGHMMMMENNSADLARRAMAWIGEFGGSRPS